VEDLNSSKPSRQLDQFAGFESLASVENSVDTLVCIDVVAESSTSPWKRAKDVAVRVRRFRI
jgi:hypothetical protein